MPTFIVNDMTCGGCAAAITQAVQKLDPAAKVAADPTTKRVDVDSAKSAAEIAEAISEAGYHVTP